MQKLFTQKKNLKPENMRSLCLAVAVVGLIGAAFLVAVFFRTGGSHPLFYGAWGSARLSVEESARLQLKAILHYATSHIVPQQNRGEIDVSFNVLQSLGGACNFLVFGLGHDSLMWAALNPRGTTRFLEEDPKWVQTVLKDSPELTAETVRYRTQLSEADELLRHYRKEPDCAPHKSFLRGNTKCRLALNMLSDEVYNTEWDMIMVDAPRGYFPEAPGRMAAIYSAAVMARRRNSSGDTHVFLHDVDRRVEKLYAEAFLCRKYLVKAVGRLWYFRILPASDMSSDFC